MASPTPFSALPRTTWQVPNMVAQKQSTNGLPGMMTPFWGASVPSQSPSAATANHIGAQLAQSSSPAVVIAGTRMTMDIAGQFCLGLGLLLLILMHH